MINKSLVVERLSIEYVVMVDYNIISAVISFTIAIIHRPSSLFFPLICPVLSFLYYQI